MYLVIYCSLHTSVFIGDIKEKNMFEMPTQMKFNTENSELFHDKTHSYERLHRSHSLTEILQRPRDLCKLMIHTKQHT